MSEKSAEDDYLRTRFLERIAHDIRGPSGVVLGVFEELERALGPEVIREHKHLFSIGRRSTKKLLRIAQKLACSAELSLGPSFSLAPVRLGVLAASAARTAEAIEGRRDVGLEVEMGGVSTLRSRDTVSVDAEWIDMILVELISNALKHARSRVDVVLQEESSSVSVAILDDGEGPAFSPQSMFQPSNECRGLGLSLAMATLVARAHRGALEVDRPEHGGCVVKLRLPRASPGGAMSQ